MGASALRRVGNIYQGKSFCTLFMHESTLTHGHIRSVVSRVDHHFCAYGSLLSSLLPKNVCTWLGILEDIFESPYLLELKASLLGGREMVGEIVNVSMDAALRILRQVKGQAHYLASAAVRAQAPVPDDQAQRRLRLWTDNERVATESSAGVGRNR